jgi:DNA-binding transcriptional ArsR family regulator
MPKYSSLPYNKEVMDVLCCVVLGYSRVSDMMKVLKQPQSTISEKLRFLRKNKVVKKSKWVYEPNWKRLTSLLRKEVKMVVEGKKLLQLFDEKRLTNIMKTYADIAIKEKAI